MQRSLVGSEMCIRDSILNSNDLKVTHDPTTDYYNCLLYTSDAADDMQCVDLGGRRIINKDYLVLLSLIHI
ncbi:hypothetical protein JMUB7515_27980 [Staphylococcus aureus]